MISKVDLAAVSLLLLAACSGTDECTLSPGIWYTAPAWSRIDVI
jgi:hypothetical protein